MFIELKDKNNNPVVIAINSIKYIHYIQNTEGSDKYTTSIKVGEGNNGEDYIHVLENVEKISLKLNKIIGVAHVSK